MLCTPIHRAAFVSLLAGLFIGTPHPETQSPQNWRLELIASIKPPEGTPGAIGSVVGMAVLSDGSVCVAEHKPARVALYDKNGVFRRVLMREGDGPGETRWPHVTAMGDTIIVYDQIVARLTYLRPDGKILRELKFYLTVSDPFHPMRAARDGRILIPAFFGESGDTRGALRIWPDGRRDTMLWNHPQSEDRFFWFKSPKWVIGGAPFSPRGAAVFDPDGRVVIGGTRASRWVVVSGRDTVRVVTLPDHPVQIAKKVRDSVWTAFRATLPKNFPDLDMYARKDLIPTTLPPWLTLEIDAQGEWWVGRPGPSGALAYWDIVSDGKVVARLNVPMPIVDVAGNTVAFGGDRAALLHEDKNGLPWIGVYHVARVVH